MSSLTPVERLQSAPLLSYIHDKLTPLLERSSSPIHILEVGCGSGALGALLKDKYKDKITYSALDPSKEAISKAHARGVSEAQNIMFSEFAGEKDHFDVVLFTKSLHHLPSVSEALAKAHTLLRPGGLLIADEFAREVADEPSSRFIFEFLDNNEASGVLPPSASQRTTVSEDKKSDYLYRWKARFEHGHAHGGGHHEHSHGSEHAHHKEFQNTEHHHGAHAGRHAAVGDSHHHGGDHQHHQHESARVPVHDHSHGLPTGAEMIEEVKKRFEDVEVSQASYLYHVVGQRFDGQTSGEDTVRGFMEDEEKRIREKTIVPIGIRILCKKRV